MLFHFAGRGRSDRALQLNHGRFRRANRGCGYILKPSPLRDPTVRFNPYDPSTFPPCVKKLTIKVARAWLGDHLCIQWSLARANR